MASKKSPGAPPEAVAAYERLVATVPEVQVKGATNPYTSLNGNMFSYLPPAGALALRLPTGIRKEFLEKYKTSLMVVGGFIQKEYVVVPGELLQNTSELTPYFAASFAYVSSLKPKPTKRA